MLTIEDARIFIAVKALAGNVQFPDKLLTILSHPIENPGFEYRDHHGTEVMRFPCSRQDAKKHAQPLWQTFYEIARFDFIQMWQDFHKHHGQPCAVKESHETGSFWLISGVESPERNKMVSFGGYTVSYTPAAPNANFREP